MNNLNFYLLEKIIEESVRGTAFYRPAFLVPAALKPGTLWAQQPEKSTDKQCRCMQVKLARTTMVRVELCS